MNDTQRSRFPATVVEVVSEDRLVLNRGSLDGLKKGQRFLVFSLGKELRDPESNESLGRLEIVRGTGTALHVQERLTTIESDTRAPTVRRTIRRNDPYAMLTGRSEETIEETGETLSFDGAEVGDLAKPL